MTWLVAGSVVWYANVAGRLVNSESPARCRCHRACVDNRGKRRCSRARLHGTTAGQHCGHYGPCNLGSPVGNRKRRRTLNEVAASADCGDGCATPVGKPLNKTLGLENFVCAYSRHMSLRPHDVAWKPCGVSAYPCENGNTPFAGVSVRSCCRPMLGPISWPNENYLRGADTCHYAESKRLERIGFMWSSTAQATKRCSPYNERY